MAPRKANFLYQEGAKTEHERTYTIFRVNTSNCRPNGRRTGVDPPQKSTCMGGNTGVGRLSGMLNAEGMALQ